MKPKSTAAKWWICDSLLLTRNGINLPRNSNEVVTMDVEELTGKAPNEIADLDSAVLEQIGDRSYLNLIEDGLTFVINDNQIIAAHLYGGDKEGFNRFPFRLPLGVAFDMSRESLRAHLGSGLADQSQKMTVAARAMAEKNVVGQRS